MNELGPIRIRMLNGQIGDISSSYLRADGSNSLLRLTDLVIVTAVNDLLCCLTEEDE
jgi:hypothetical protein